MRKTPIDFLSSSVLQGSSGEDLFTAGEKNLVGHNESFLLQLHEQKKIFFARADARAQRTALAAKMHFSLGEGVVLSALEAEWGHSSSTPRYCRRLGKRASTLPRRIDLDLTSGTFPQKNQRRCHSHEALKFTRLFRGLELQKRASRLDRAAQRTDGRGAHPVQNPTHCRARAGQRTRAQAREICPPSLAEGSR